MTKTNDKPLLYKDLKLELDELLANLQHENLDVDQALAAYKRGQELINQMDEYLEKATNTITEIKPKKA